jgi:hypothetical protein
MLHCFELILELEVSLLFTELLCPDFEEVLRQVIRDTGQHSLFQYKRKTVHQGLHYYSPYLALYYSTHKLPLTY